MIRGVGFVWKLRLFEVFLKNILEEIKGRFINFVTEISVTDFMYGARNFWRPPDVA